MDKCGICLKPAVQLFETGDDGVYACFKCQPLVPEVTIGDSVPEVIISDTDPTDQAEIIKIEDASQLRCGVCQKTFQKSAQLHNHLRNHRAERRFVCTYCNKAFSQSNNLRAHLRIHTNERPYKCNECGKAFTQVTNLNNHVRLHTGERPFVCPEPGCNKAYAQVTNLNQHRKRHINGRPVETAYECSACGEQFQQRNHMYSHRRDVHGIGAEKGAAPRRRHVCQLCELAFPNQQMLQHHVAQHVAQTDDTQANDAHSDGSGSGGESSEGSFSCVFKACGARFSSPRAHTEHLLRAHQLRVLAARAPHPPRRGRPPKAKEEDPLEIKETEFRPIKIVNAQDIKLASKLKIQSLFQ